MEHTEYESGARRRVLVIDDSELARACMIRLLERAGYEVFELSSAIGATRCILNNDVRAVVVDLSMPGLSGDKLVRVLRGNARLAGLIIVIVSGRTNEELQQVAVQMPADAVLAKDQLESRLLPVLERALGHAPASRAGHRRT